MTRSIRELLLVLGLCLAGIITHMLPHEMGVSTVGLISMLAAAYVSPRFMLVPALATVLVVDALNGYYGALAMSFVYLGHLAGVLAIRPLLAKTGPANVLSASLVNASVFYLLSNLTPMAMGFYPPTVEGLVNCYINGLPFLLRGSMANLLFGAVVFGAIHVAGEWRAHRQLAARRH